MQEFVRAGCACTDVTGYVAAQWHSDIQGWLLLWLLYRLILNCAVYCLKLFGRRLSNLCASSIQLWSKKQDYISTYEMTVGKSRGHIIEFHNVDASSRTCQFCNSGACCVMWLVVCTKLKLFWLILVCILLIPISITKSSTVSQLQYRLTVCYKFITRMHMKDYVLCHVWTCSQIFIALNVEVRSLPRFSSIFNMVCLTTLSVTYIL